MLENSDSLNSPNAHDSKVREKLSKQNKRMGYVVLYLVVLVIVVVGEIILFKIDKEASLLDLFRDMIGNLMGVLAAFLVFDLAHDWISKDVYASEVSEQILDTLMYHPEVIENYEDKQKKVFVNSFITSIVKNEYVSDMISSYLDSYLITSSDFKYNKRITERDCRIRTAFSYRFVLETTRTKAFGNLQPYFDKDPYFYVQEEFSYTVAYLNEMGNNIKGNNVNIAFIYDNAALDRFLRGNRCGEDEELLTKCIFRETLEIEDCDKEYFKELDNTSEIVDVVQKMFRPHLTIDGKHGKVTDVEVKDFGLVIMFDIEHNVDAVEHDIEIIFHMPKKWDSVLEVAIVEPTRDAKISVSYNEDEMDIDMYPFLNKSESSSYDSALEDENGVYSISMNNEWVLPVSGVIFTVKRDLKSGGIVV
jgi:hypothetical protein